MTIPLRGVILALILATGIAIAVITIVPLNLAARESVDATIARLRNESGRRMTREVLSFFSSATTPAITLQGFFEMGAFDPTLPNRNSTGLAPAFCFMSRSSGFLVYMGTDAGGFFTCSGTGLSVSLRNFSTGVNDGFQLMRNTTQVIVNESSRVPGRNLYDPRRRPWYPVLKAGRMWTGLYVNFNSTEIANTVGGPVSYQGAVMAALALDVTTTTLIGYLSTVKISRRTRIALVETSTGYVLALSWTSLATKLANATTGTYRLMDISETDDPVMSYVLSSFPAKYASLRAEPLPLDTSVYSTVVMVPRAVAGVGPEEASGESIRTFFDMMPIRDAFGLDLRMFVMIPESDFNGQFVQAFNVSLGIAIGVLVVCVVAAGLAAFLLLSPLNELAESMDVTETLASEPAAPPQTKKSVLSEIRTIQTKYEILTKQLRRVRSFLPQTILIQLAKVNYDSDDDDEADRSTAANQQQHADGSANRRTQSSDRDKDSRRQSRLPRATSSNHVPGEGSTTGDRLSETRSVRSGASMRSRRDAGGAVVPHNPDAMSRVEQVLAASSKGVTLLVTNLRGFHRVLAEVSVALAQELQNKYITLLSRAADDHRGVVHAIHGDHAVISFNASKRCISHGEKGAHCALALARLIATELATLVPSTGLEASMGVATGIAMVGQAGCDGLRQFSIIGNVYRVATVLERMTKSYPRAAFPLVETTPADGGAATTKISSNTGASTTRLMCLLDAATADATDTSLFTRIIDIIPPLSSTRGGPAAKASVCLPISVIHGCHADAAEPVLATTEATQSPPVNNPESAAQRSPGRSDLDAPKDNEWIYALHRAQSGDVHYDINAAFRKLAKGQALPAADIDTVRANARRADSEVVAAAVKRLEELDTLRGGGAAAEAARIPVEALAQQWGRYYATAVMN